MVCIFDIDGVLNEYPETWVEFVNAKTNFNFKDLNEVKEHLSYNSYKDLKSDYRESDFKATLKPVKEAKEVLDCLKSLGYDIIIMTARPIKKHIRLYKTTLQWFERNSLCFDNIIFEEKKQINVLSEFPETKFIVEDNRETANLLSNFGFKVYLKDNKYNQGEINKKIIRIKTLKEIGELNARK